LGQEEALEALPVVLIQELAVQAVKAKIEEENQWEVGDV
jgi:hypothetical protein